MVCLSGVWNYLPEVRSALRGVGGGDEITWKLTKCSVEELGKVGFRPIKVSPWLLTGSQSH